MATEVLPPQTLRTTLNYHLEPERGGAAIWCPGTVQDKRRPHEHKDVDVFNIRGRETEFTLDQQGFQIIPFAPTSETNFDDKEDIEGQYYQDVVAHLKKVTGATKVVPVVHICRQKPWEEVAAAEKDLPDGAPVTRPTYNRSVHIDQSYDGAELVRINKLSKLQNESDADIKKLQSSPWAIINLWRPLNNVTRDNLACCDARTVDEDDLAAVKATLSPELVNSKNGYNFAAGSRSEAWEVKVGSGSHRWYYAANMTPDEALLIKQFDSREGVAKRTPHCAFTAEEDYGPTRLSIEVRCLCFFEDEAQNGV